MSGLLLMHKDRMGSWTVATARMTGTGAVERVAPTAQNRRGTASGEEGMIDEDEKEQIHRLIMRAFDIFSHQHYRNLFAGTLGAGGAGAAFIEDRFLQVRACDINSYMRVLDRRTKSRPTMKHRKMLVNAAIRSMAKGCFGLSDIGDGPDDGARRSYTDRHRQRLIHERYGDAILEPEAVHECGDDRVKRLSTVFSESKLPRSRDADMARAYLDAGSVAAYALRGDRQRWIGLNSALRLAFPQFLCDMLEFRKECRAVFESLGERNDRIDFLREHLVDGPGLLDVFYSQFSSILDVAWFRTLPEDGREQLLRPATETKYSPADARKVSAMLSGIYGRDLACHMLNICGNAFLQFDRPRAAVLVFMECTSMAKGDMQRGWAWQNVAATHRISQNFRLGLGAMKKALPHFEATGDAYRICNALQLIGEFRWRLGSREAAWRSFKKMENHSTEMKENERWKIPVILGMTFGRLGEMRQRRRCLVRALAMIPEGEADAFLRVNAMINDERPVSPDDRLHPDLGRMLDKATDELYGVLLGREDQAGKIRPEAAGRGAVDQGCTRDRGSGA